MKLSGPQIKQLHAALLSGFPTSASLRWFVRTELEENLDAITGGDNLSEIVGNLILWAQALGQLENLVRKAYETRPKNPEILDFMRQHVSLLVPSKVKP